MPSRAILPTARDQAATGSASVAGLSSSRTTPQVSQPTLSVSSSTSVAVPQQGISISIMALRLP